MCTSDFTSMYCCLTQYSAHFDSSVIQSTTIPGNLEGYEIPPNPHRDFSTFLENYLDKSVT